MRRLALVLLAPALVAACAQSPTTPSAAAPATAGPRARPDSGPLGGSGNRVDPDLSAGTATMSGPLGGSGN